MANKYIEVLKGAAKKSPYKTIDIGAEQIQTLSGNSTLIYHCDISGDGEYEMDALDMIGMDIAADISSYRKGDRNWKVPTHQTTMSGTLPKDLVASLSKAAKFVSKDKFRPILNQIHLEGGEIWATDGYRASIDHNDSIEGITADLDIDHVATMKKIGGDWEINAGEGFYQLTNGTLEIWQHADYGAFPRMRAVVGAERLGTDTKILLPYKAIKGALEKHNQVNIQEDGTIIVNFRPLPVKATIEKEDHTYGENDSMLVLMPLEGGDGQTITAVDADLLKHYPTDKNGNLAIRAKGKKPGILFVVQ